MSFKVSKQMCKDLESFYATEKDPSLVELDQVNHKWFVPGSTSDIEEMPLDFQNSKTVDVHSTGKKDAPIFLTHYNNRNSLDPTDRTSKDSDNHSITRSSFNPIKVIGSKVNNIFTWFKKKKSTELDEYDLDGDQSSHRSADIEE